jgi:hypothetical protein
MKEFIHNPVLPLLLACVASGCSVYGSPGADNGGAAGTAREAGAMTTAGQGGMGGSGDAAGNTEVGSGGASDDSGESESTVISEIMDGSTDVGESESRVIREITDGSTDVREAAAADAGPCAGTSLASTTTSARRS